MKYTDDKTGSQQNIASKNSSYCRILWVPHSYVAYVTAQLPFDLCSGRNLVQMNVQDSAEQYCVNQSMSWSDTSEKQTESDCSSGLTEVWPENNNISSLSHETDWNLIYHDKSWQFRHWSEMAKVLQRILKRYCAYWWNKGNQDLTNATARTIFSCAKDNHKSGRLQMHYIHTTTALQRYLQSRTPVCVCPTHTK